MSIYSAGTVADVVSSVAYQGSATEAGARWLNAYIDPAHGNCDTIPDEDNVYSTPFKSHFTISLDRGFFVNPQITSEVPSRSFTVYLTSFPDYPIAVFGTFYDVNTSGATYAVDRLVYIPDPNLKDVIANKKDVNSLRMMYKGMTCRYTGNAYNNQGVLTSCQYAFTDEYIPLDVDDGKGTVYTYNSLQCHLPSTSSGIAASNKEFYVNRQDMGVYCSNQIMGPRSNYVANHQDYKWMAIAINDGSPATTFPPGWVREYGNRFSDAIKPEGYFPGATYNFNCTWVVNRFDNIEGDQSVLIEHFGGYQAHVGYDSKFVNFQSFKSYLDPNALATASQLTASLPCIWPASYNDFKAVWRRIGSFIGSSSGQSLINSIAAISGRYGGLISAIGGLFS